MLLPYVPGRKNDQTTHLSENGWRREDEAAAPSVWFFKLSG